MRRRNEGLLVTFTVATNLADAVTKVALPLLAVRLTDSPALIAAVAVLLTLPWLVTALHVGVLVDRLDRRRLMVGAEVARIAAIAVLLAAVAVDGVTLPLLYAVALGLGVAEVVALTAGASIVPAAVERRRWQTVTARITAAEYLCNGFVGAPVGGSWSRPGSRSPSARPAWSTWSGPACSCCSSARSPRRPASAGRSAARSATAWASCCAAGCCARWPC
jgi:MFS family permease